MSGQSVNPGLDELRDLAEIGLKMAKHDLLKGEGITPVFVLRYPDGSIKQLPFPEEASVLMNDGEAKSILFGYIRAIVQKYGITATVFVTDGWGGKATPKGKQLSPAELQKLAFQTACREGYIERSEALLATVQTAAEALTIVLLYERRDNPPRIIWGERQELHTTQDCFAGRQKMYGDLREENVR